MDPTQPRGSREPFLEQIIDSAGHGFSGGFIGGAAFHFLKGIYNSPKGTRFIHGTEAAIMNAPRLGGEFGVFCTTVTVLECTVSYARQKDDPWNSIISGFLTGGLFRMRRGLQPMMRGAVRLGTVFALFEGASIMLDRLSGARQQQHPGPPLLLQHDPQVSDPASSPSPNTSDSAHEVAPPIEF